MASVVLVWEMGGEYGHVSRLLTIGEAFRARGHTVSYVLKDLSRAEAMIAPTGARCYQAPHWVPTISGLPDPVNCAETLIRFGYLEAEALTGLCRAWRNLFELLAPDLLFCDFAPTALLAARGMAWPTAVSDTGYGIPPARAPLPPYRWWLEHGPAPLAGAEARVLDSVNLVTAALGVPRYAAVHEVFRGDRTFLCTYAELDHYPERETGEYFGAVANLDTGHAPAWPGGSGPRVFVYLRPDYPGLAPLCRELANAGARVVAFVPGIDAQTRDAIKSRRVTIADRPLRMDVVRDQCVAAICHAGLGTTAAVLAAGKPVLLLPNQTEQGMVAMRVQRLGAGLVCDAGRVVGQAAALVAALLGDTRLRDAARAFARRYRGHTQAAAVNRMVDGCEALMAEAGTQETAPG